MKTKLAKDEVVAQAVGHFSADNYNIQSQTENSIIFRDGKDINWVLFIFLFICVIALGAIIYWVVAKEHQVILQFRTINDYLEVTAIGNSKKSQSTASAFLSSLPPVLPPSA